MSFCKTRACYLPSSFKHRKAQRFPRPVCRRPVGKQKLWIAVGTDIRHRDPCLRTPASRRTIRVGLPEIQLVFSILFFVEKRRVVLFPEGRRKLSDHFLSHFIAVLADAGADTGRHISRIRAVLLFHGRQDRGHAVYGPSPAEWARPMALFSGPENTAARSRQKRSPASRRAGL